MPDDSPKTVADVFEALGGPAEVARRLDLKGASTASEMKRRGRIGVEHFPRLVDIGAQLGLSWLTYETLVLMHARKSFEPAGDL